MEALFFAAVALVSTATAIYLAGCPRSLALGDRGDHEPNQPHPLLPTRQRAPRPASALSKVTRTPPVSSAIASSHASAQYLTARNAQGAGLMLWSAPYGLSGIKPVTCCFVSSHLAVTWLRQLTISRIR